MAELAVCGSLMLMALALLVRYGMSYVANQKMTMSVFRAAVSEAYYKGEGQQQWYKDADIADPQDMFGFGSRQVVSSGAGITWTNSTYVGQPPAKKDDGFITGIIDKIYEFFDISTSPAPAEEITPTITYTFINGETKAAVKKTYTIAEYKTVAPSSVDVYYSFLPNVVTIPAGNMKEDQNTSLLKVLVNENGGGPGTCGETYCPTDILTRADVDHDTYEEEIRSVSGSSMRVLDFQDGEINQAKLSGMMSDYQGVEPTQDMTVNRNDVLSVSDGSGYLSADSSRSESVGITYHIRTSGGRDAVTINSGTHGGWSTGGAK